MFSVEATAVRSFLARGLCVTSGDGALGRAPLDRARISASAERARPAPEAERR